MTVLKGVRCLTVVLICIFLMISDAEQLFIYMFIISMPSLKNVPSYSLPILDFLPLSSMRSLYILPINPYQIYNLQIFSYTWFSFCWLFPLLSRSFLVGMCIPPTYFCFGCLCFGCQVQKKSFLILTSRSLLPIFSSRSFISGFIFRHLIHFE